MPTPTPSPFAPGSAPASTPDTPTVHLIDDDAMVRSALARLLASHGYRVCTYGDADEFLARFDSTLPGCLLLDVWMPGMSGLELRGRLEAAGYCPPIVFMSGVRDIPTCACAMRGGAIHFLTKPVDEAELLPAVQEAIRHDAARRSELHHRSVVAHRWATLTPREREVLGHVMQGRLNKQIASDLGTAEKTVKVHRARGMEKMGVRSVAELVKMIERAGGEGDTQGSFTCDPAPGTPGCAASGSPDRCAHSCSSAGVPRTPGSGTAARGA